MEEDTDSDVRRSNPQTINSVMLQPPRPFTHLCQFQSLPMQSLAATDRRTSYIFIQKYIGCTLQTNAITR